MHSFGLGLRKPHYAEFLNAQAPVDFCEVISENFMAVGGKPRAVLHGVRAHYPVALHGVSMSLGSAQGLDRAYLAALRRLVDEIEPVFVSDHLCWTRTPGWQSHDLLPLPYTTEALAVVCANLDLAQATLGRQMLLENPSSYVSFAQSEISEAEFLAQVVRRTGCGLLLDINNIHVSAMNHGFDAEAYLAAIPFADVRQIHLAGHTQTAELLIDTHDRPVPPPVWELFGKAIRRCPPGTHVMIERDDAIPPLGDLLAELDMARKLAAERLAA
jgi:uncharacterized protein (UPF0276 family)